MNEGSIKNNPSNWNKENIQALKISSLNCRSLRSKIEDIRRDFELNFSVIICLSETWLQQDDNLVDLDICDFKLHVNSVGYGKGLATYYKQGKFKHEVDIKQDLLQVSKFKSEKLDIVSVYRSQDSKANLKDILEKLVTKKRPTLIL